MQDYKKIEHATNRDVVLRYVPGHFITPNSHVNYYMDLTDMKSRQREARATGEELAQAYMVSDIVDTILCLDNMEVVGAYLANKLTKAGVHSMNSHQTIYIASPEYDSGGTIIFRQNSKHMVRGKKVLLLLATVSTGNTLQKAIEGINYYGGEVMGISAIFSAATKVMDIPVNSLFGPKDLPDYKNFRPDDCPMCRAKESVDALCNGFGYSLV